MKRRSSKGFTLVELAIVATIIGILLRIGLPAYANFVRNARAAQAIGDFNAIRAAAFAYHASTNGWPPEYATGVIPTELVTYLPRNFSFVKPYYSMDWEYWVLPNGTPSNPASGVMLGISVNTADASLGRRVQSILGGSMGHYSSGNSYTFVISSTADGAP
jgi:prepilin-type N-terminal cleavage/methylation domain-containing protein